MSINNIDITTEDTLKDAVNSKFLVVFRPKGDTNYRMFGWQYGASLTYNQDITSDDASFKLEFNYSTEFPLFSVDPDNFNLASKVFTPLFKV
jgi:hypothetical protein